METGTDKVGPRYKTIAEQEKARTIAQQAECEPLKIYKTRLKSGDGWRFIAAKSAQKARKALGVPMGVTVVAATREEVLLIAVRAITGNC